MAGQFPWGGQLGGESGWKPTKSREKAVKPAKSPERIGRGEQNSRRIEAHSLLMILYRSRPGLIPSAPGDFSRVGSIGRSTKGARAVNSAVECHLHTVEVAGSNPAPPTIRVVHYNEATSRCYARRERFRAGMKSLPRHG